MTRIAIVGMACQYPDARSPEQLWENVLAGRRAFRRLPDARIRLADYWDPDPGRPDRFYARTAAVIEGYEFDRIGYRIAGSTFRSTDLSHWLALDVAAQALADAGFPMAEGLPRQRTGVVVGNTLTGEFTRANTMRLRWPYVRRTLIAALRGDGWADEKIGAFLGAMEARYKLPFPGVDEDTLAGALSNTIAGRICNYFDLGGGGYTVDAACSSSLLSVITAARALVDGELDVAVAGGVDLSIDPFEMVGFAKTGALATGEMRVYDRHSNGFWPGEGAGMVVLMRDAEARAQHRRVYASVAGWGISSDGRGGMTRPGLGGYQLALDRAYERTGFAITSVSLFEGHGTGTAVGDSNELRALSSRRGAAGAPAAIGSVKAMIGHTKAAAGVAGLIKAALAVHHRILPPTVGCVDPHPELTAPDAALRVLAGAEPWPTGQPVRAGVTAMGFGGINSHVVLEGEPGAATPAMVERVGAITVSRQDTEVLLVDASTVDELAARLEQLAEFVPALAWAELTDLAVTLHSELADRPWRAAVVVDSPETAETALRNALDLLARGAPPVLDARRRVFIGRAGAVPPRIGLLFPGQGSGIGTRGGALRRRFPDADTVYREAALPPVDPHRGEDGIATAVAQPRIVAGSLAGLAALRSLGLVAEVAVGHSLGELSALHWAGAMDAAALLRVARVRGETMTEHSSPGAMAGVGLPADAAERFLVGEPVVVAGYNGPRQTVVAGPVEAVRRVGSRVAVAGESWAMLPVSHAFHSPLVAPSADRLAERLGGSSGDGEAFAPLTRPVFSTITGAKLDPDTDVVRLLHRQITAPVRFAQALAGAAELVDLFIEVGPGRVLTRMAPDITDVPALPMETDSESLADLLGVVAAAFVLGAPVRLAALLGDRVSRPLPVGGELRFFANPCEDTDPASDLLSHDVPVPAAPSPVPATPGDSTSDTLGLLRRLVAERAELPLESVHELSLLLDDLHLSSITVGHIVDEAARQLGLHGVQAPTNFATATLRELADAMTLLADTAQSGDPDRAVPAGAADWIRAFTVDLVEVALPTPGPTLTAADSGDWRVFTPGHPLAEPLGRALEQSGLGPGILVCLPVGCTVDDLLPALAAARQAATAGPGRFVLVQHDTGAGALARSLRRETPHVHSTVVRVPGESGADESTVDKLVSVTVAEVAATAGFSEVHYDRDWRRRVPTLRALDPPGTPDAPAFDGRDVLLVTGGGKGITAECALGLATGTGAAVAILGRSAPGTDVELATNLTRMRERGLRVHYARADVTDPAAVRAAVAEICDALGPVTAVLHGAGHNEPTALANLDEATLRRALAPKVDGLDAVLAAVDPAALRCLVTFGSVIGRVGLRGEAHYATANEWLAARTEAYAAGHPHCRCLCLEWSVWSGVGMGERLAVVESLLREGIVPVAPERGVDMLRALLADPPPRPVVVVTGRTGDVDTIRVERPPLPLLRFLERTLVRYPSVELVTEVDLSLTTDPYLEDHELDGTMLFPAVMGLEAMAQVAVAALDRCDPAGIAFENVAFARPIVVPKSSHTTIRVAATVTGPDRLAVAIRSAETGYAVDHFTATVSFAGPTTVVATDNEVPAALPAHLPAVPLHPTQLYDAVLFQGKRFQRLLRYRRAAARHVDADLAVSDQSAWFSPFLPGDLLIGDPGLRDALMHGNQVCVPDATLLPVGVDRIEPCCDGLDGETEVGYTAVEREQDGDMYVYDVAVRARSGEVVERWYGLRLRAVRAAAAQRTWLAPLLGPYLERGVGARIGLDVAVTVEPAPTRETADRRTATTLAVSRALGGPTAVRYRPDGRPEVDGHGVSVAHATGLTLAVACAGGRTVTCDLEPVRGKDPSEVLGAAAVPGGAAALAAAIGAGTGESPATAGTRIWCAVECLRKAGVPAGPLVLSEAAADGWVLLRSGELRVATFVASMRDVVDPVVFAILGQEG